eukprot:PRCOL_00005397-RA
MPPAERAPTGGAWGAFERHRLLLLRGGARARGGAGALAELLRAAADEADAADAEWTVENEGLDRRGDREGGGSDEDGGDGHESDDGAASPGCRLGGAADLSAHALLGSLARRGADTAASAAIPARFYVSTVLNGGAAARVGAAAAAVPDALRASGAEHSEPLWIFIGSAGEAPRAREADSRGGGVSASRARGPKRRRTCATSAAGAPLRGRAEHTDAVSQSGTFHVQVSGTKTWRLRPAGDEAWEELGSVPPALHEVAEAVAEGVPNTEVGADGTRRLRIDCKEGDVLLVDTRRWLHATELPVTDTALSVSYARDFFLWGECGGQDGALAAIAAADKFTNVSAGTLAFECSFSTGEEIVRDADVPEGAEVGMSASNPNAEYAAVWDEDELTGEVTEVGTALVAMRHIRAGEFICVAPDSGDEYSYEEDAEGGSSGDESD